MVDWEVAKLKIMAKSLKFDILDSNLEKLEVYQHQKIW